MSVTLFVGPLLDPEEINPKELQRYQAILDDLNGQLASRGLPPYCDPPTSDADAEEWTAMLSNQWIVNLHSLLDSLDHHQELGITLRHLVDPAEHGVHYFPIDFPDPIPSAADPDMLYASCHGLQRELEAIARWLAIPLERFAVDFSGDGLDKEEEWSAIYDDLAGQDALCTRLAWSSDDIDSVMEQIRDFCEDMGLNQEDYEQKLIEDYGSLEAYAEALNAENPSDEENNIALVFTLVNYYHGCRHAITHGLTFGIG